MYCALPYVPGPAAEVPLKSERLIMLLLPFILSSPSPLELVDTIGKLTDELMVLTVTCLHLQGWLEEHLSRQARN